MQAYDEVILPITFLRRVVQMRYGQLNDSESVHTKELEQLVDEDIKIISRLLTEKASKSIDKEQLSL